MFLSLSEAGSRAVMGWCCSRGCLFGKWYLFSQRITVLNMLKGSCGIDSGEMAESVGRLL